jgi:hypothetical protein
VLAHRAAGLVLTDTNAKVLDINHYQVETSGGAHAHLLRVVTSLDLIDAAIDADALLADGQPLVMTWRRDAGDADLIDFSLALAIDDWPCHLEVTLRRNGAQAPTFDTAADVSTNGSTVMIGPSRAIVFFSEPIDPLDDIHVGDVPTGVPLRARSAPAWRIDVSPLSDGEEFDIVVRAGPPGDFDLDGDVGLDDYQFFAGCFTGQFAGDYNGDGDVDLYDFAKWESCLRGPTVPSAGGCLAKDLDTDGGVDLADFAVFQGLFTGSQLFDCEAADFDTDQDVDLRDFSMFQAWFSGEGVPASCGEGS